MEMDQFAKDLNKLNLQIKKLGSAKVLNDYEKVEILKKAAGASNLISFSELSSKLDKLIVETQARIDASLEQRRETLLVESRKSGLVAKRFGDYDRIDIFRVTYKGKKVRLEVGSELLEEFVESDGLKVLEKIQEERTKLHTSPFKRERFFRLLQYSCFLAQRETGGSDQWAPVRMAYTYMTLLRNVDSEGFVKAPTQKKFIAYSTAQFVFDLARFGSAGWSCENYVVRSQTPNMSTVAAKKAVTLPDISNPEKLGPQLAVLKIVKSDG